MSQTVTETQVAPTPTLILKAPVEEKPEDEYQYSNLLPHFSRDHYPPLTPFTHSDPGLRALDHPHPRAFLDRATSVVELTPRLGTEVHGVNLAELDSDARDELALEARRVTCGTETH
jgi:sulfonate dioxygenase